MKKYLLIANDGHIEEDALTLVGASTKVGDSSKIGMFGSGTKYALAYLLRNKHEVLIYSGLDPIVLGSVKKTFREQDFDVITINGKQTSITTQMGKDWELWQAIREIYANAIDEGGIIFKEVDEIEPNKDMTSIYISMNSELESIIFNLRDYFANEKEIIYENEYGRIYRKHSTTGCVYRMGIRCNETSKPSVFDYDFNELEINENRMAKFNFTIPEAIYKLFSKCTDPRIIRELLVGVSKDHNVIEANIDSYYTIMPFDTDTVRESMKGKQAVPRSLAGLLKAEEIGKSILLPDKLYNIVVSAGVAESDRFTITPSGVIYQEAELDNLQRHMLSEVLQFFKECGYKYIRREDIKIVKFDNPDIHGAVMDMEILLSVTAFDKGKHEVASTLLEEYIHIKSNASDESRKMQNAILNEFLTYMKNVNAYDL